MSNFITSVSLKSELCVGCTTCLKRCPTGAIRVRNGKASIITERCIDCGECIRVCPHHAKKANFDKLDILNNFKYTVALPAPSFYAQFNNLDDPNIILTALKLMGFSDVFEVAAGAELVSEASRKYIAEHPENKPYISTACPTVARLIRVRFPELIDNLMPINAPIDFAAEIAAKNAMQKTGLDRKDIGIIFITPCPAKVTAIRHPLWTDTCEIDGVIAVKEIYPKILPFMQKAATEGTEDITLAGKIGVSWGAAGGEVSGLLTDHYIAVDGIENVISVLEDLEDRKISDLDFLELNACRGGCVGGVLQVENPFVAKTKLKILRKYLPVSSNHLEDYNIENMYWDRELEYQPVFRLGNNVKESMRLVQEVDEIEKHLPGLDCGSCGAPSCRALAEDIVKGLAKETDCVPLLKNYLKKISDDFKKL